MSPSGDPLEAAERGAEPLEARADLVQRRAERLRQRSRPERVVDVVEARERQAGPASHPAGVSSVERRRLEPVELDLTRRAPASAGRAWPQSGQR